MAVPISFPSTTANLSLPLLFTGQAQKEFSLNQAFSVVDALLQRGVLDSLATPPSSTQEGDCYRILPSPSGDWSGHEDAIAVSLGGAWHIVAAVEGMQIYDRSAGQILHYQAGWQSASEPVAPTGGSTIDTEARAAIAELIEALRNVGILTI